MSKKSVIDNSKNKLDTAVIIVHQSDSYFSIIAKDEPYCLIPMVNVPIIYYTIIQLLHAKFTNFIIFCGVHKKKIEEFIKSLNIDFLLGKCKTQYINAEIKTTGDAIRYLDNQKFEKKFLLINGDVVTDMNYNSLINTFEKERSSNRDVKMARILSRNLSEELRLFTKITNDLNDPEIFICSNEIQLRFTEHQDCTNMDDLIEMMISHAEAVPDKFQDIIVNNSCYRVRDLNTYAFVSKHLIRGMISQLSPSNIFGDNIKVIPSSGKILTNFSSCYINSKLPADYISSSSKLIGNVQIQNGTKIGDNCRLDDSIIGYNCQIGNNVTLKNCFIMSDVVIENNCTIVDSFLCSGCKINNNCVITDKSVVDYNFDVIAKSKFEKKVLSHEKMESFWDAGITHKLKSDEITIDDIEPDNEEIDNDVLFGQDLHLLMKEALKDNMSVDNLIIETNRLRHHYQLDVEDLCYQVINTFVSFFIKEPMTEKFRDHFASLLSKYGKLITAFTGSNTKRIISCLEAVEESACYNPKIMENVLDIYYLMYDKDIATENDILKWYNESSLLIDTELQLETKNIRDRLSEFIKYLEEAEEESD